MAPINNDKEHTATDRSLPLVSIIIPCFNRLGYFKECFDSIIEQSYRNYEVIVIDDNSLEDIRGFLLRRCAESNTRIKYVRNRRNLYPSFAKNEGILLAEGDYLHFIDSDSKLFQKDCILESVLFLENHSEYAAVGGEAGFDESGKHVSVHTTHFEINKSYTVDIREHFFEPGAFKDVDILDTSNLMIGKRTIELAGGFDPGYKYPHEDSDLCYRLKKLDFNIAIGFDAAVIHARAPSNRMNQAYFVSRARMRYQIKHFRPCDVRFYNVFDKSPFDILLGRMPGVYDSLRPPMEIYPTPDMVRPAEIAQPKHRLLSKLFQSGFSVHRAIVYNIFHLREIRASRNRNFLEDDRLKESVRGGEILC